MAGVGTCARAPVQGVEHFRGRNAAGEAGLVHEETGGGKPSEVGFLAAFEFDRRKVGLPLAEAGFAAPDRARRFQPSLSASDVRVRMDLVLDGIADHMPRHDNSEAFRVADDDPIDVEAALRGCGAQPHDGDGLGEGRNRDEDASGSERRAIGEPRGASEGRSP